MSVASRLRSLKGLTLHDVWAMFKRWRKSVNFITTILLYAAGTAIICSSLLYFIENGDGYLHLPFIDALFLGVSAFTASGLNSINFSEFSTPSLVMLYITVQLGSIVLLTTLPSILRVRTFRKRLRNARAALKVAETEKDAMHQLAYCDALAKRANICYVIIFSCFLYWFMCQFIFWCLVFVDKGAWWSLFHVTSAFNNAGFALAPDNMYPIRENNYLLIVFSLVMPLGNTLFPVFFRLQMIGTLYLVDWAAVRRGDSVWFGSTLRDWVDAVETLVDRPRDHYTHMFAPKETFILFILWVVLTVAEFIMFIPEFNTQVFPPESQNSIWNQLCIAIFQTVTVRTCGFSAMNLNEVHIGHLAFWILMMYVSTYPFIVAEQVTSSAVKENSEGKSEYTKYKEQAVSYVGRDLIWLYLVVMAVCIAENYDIITDVKGRNDNFLRVLFEVSSAFGTVGLSLAYPTPGGVSFSGDLNSFSKFMIILTMFAGKHRGLPPAVDKSIVISETAMLDEMSDLANPPSEVASERDRALSLISNDSRGSVDEDDPSMPLLVREQSIKFHGNLITTKHNKDVVHDEFSSPVKPNLKAAATYWSPEMSPTTNGNGPQFPNLMAGYQPPSGSTDGPASGGRVAYAPNNNLDHFQQRSSHLQTTPYASEAAIDPSKLAPASLNSSNSAESEVVQGEYTLDSNNQGKNPANGSSPSSPLNGTARGLEVPEPSGSFPPLERKDTVAAPKPTSRRVLDARDE